MKYFFQSLKFKIIFTNSIIILVFIIAISLLWQKTYIANINNSTERYANYIIENANKQLEKTLKTIEYNMVTLLYDNNFMGIMTNPYSKDNVRQLNNNNYILGKLRPYMALNEHIKKVIVVTQEEKFYSPTTIRKWDKERVKEYFKIAAQSKETFICLAESEENSYNNDGLKEISIIRPVYYANKAVALIIVDLDTYNLLQYYSAIGEFDFGLILYDNNNKEFIYSTDLSNLNLGNEFLISDYIDKNIKQDDYDINMINNQNFFFKEYKLSDFGWRVIVFISQKSLLKEYMGAAKLGTIIMMISLISCFIIVSIMIRITTRNITKLANAVEQVNGENLELKVKINSKDEIGLLYRKFAQMLERIMNQMNIIKNNEREKRKLQYKALQAQINPHFLYNSLNTIKFLANLQGSMNIVEVSEALSNLMHVNMSKREYFTLEEEIEYLKSYICMQEYKYGKSLEFVYEIEDNLEKALILKLLIQPVLENSIKHGGVLDKLNGRIRIRAYEYDSKLYIQIEDNGCGMQQKDIDFLFEHLEESDNIGLYNIIQRIKLNYGEEYEVILLSEPTQYMIVQYILPLQYNND